MKRPRIIPILLINGKRLEKTVQFSHPRYIGDPLNAVKIFNDKYSDELIIIDYTTDSPQFNFIDSIASECFMPLTYGGGIGSVAQVEKLINFGIEKVSLNRQAIYNPQLIEDIAKRFGSQAVVVSIDVKKDWFKRRYVYAQRGKKRTKYTALDHAKRAVDYGAGEILITSIKHEGMMKGFDLDLINEIVDSVSVPVIAHGGAGDIRHIQSVLHQAGASAVACGSLFVYTGKSHGILISYFDELVFAQQLTKQSMEENSIAETIEVA